MERANAIVTSWRWGPLLHHPRVPLRIREFPMVLILEMSFQGVLPSKISRTGINQAWQLDATMINFPHMALHIISVIAPLPAQLALDTTAAGACGRVRFGHPCTPLLQRRPVNEIFVILVHLASLARISFRRRG